MIRVTTLIPVLILLCDPVALVAQDPPPWPVINRPEAGNESESDPETSDEVDTAELPPESDGSEAFDVFEELPPGTRVSLDFADARLAELVPFFSQLTGMNFMFEDADLGDRRITIVAPTPVSIDEAVRAFHAALYMNGMIAFQVGDFWRIADADTAPGQPLPIYVIQ